VQDKISNALVRDGVEGYINPFMVLNELESGLKNHTLIGSDGRNSARINLRLGSHYLARMLERYDGNVAMAAAAYNAGPGNLARWLPAAQRRADPLLLIESIPAGETRAFVQRVLADIVGPDGVRAQEPTMGAEDFSYMLQARPGCYLFIGNGDGAHRAGYEDGGHDAGPCTLHNPHYDFNDELIPLGATFWVRLVEQWLTRPRT